MQPRAAVDFHSMRLTRKEKGSQKNSIPFALRKPALLSCQRRKPSKINRQLGFLLLFLSGGGGTSECTWSAGSRAAADSDADPYTDQPDLQFLETQAAEYERGVLQTVLIRK